MLCRTQEETLVHKSADDPIVVLDLDNFVGKNDGVTTEGDKEIPCVHTASWPAALERAFRPGEAPDRIEIASIARSLAGLPEPEYVRGLAQRLLCDYAYAVDLNEDQLEQSLPVWREDFLRKGVGFHTSLTRYGLPLFAELRRRRIPAAIGTGSSTRFAEWYLKRHGIDDVFSVIIAADTPALNSRYKPDLNTWRLAVALLSGIPAEEVTRLAKLPGALEEAVNAIDREIWIGEDNIRTAFEASKLHDRVKVFLLAGQPETINRRLNEFAATLDERRRIESRIEVIFDFEPMLRRVRRG